MKRADTIAAIRALGLTVTVTDGEWRIAPPLMAYAKAYKSQAMRKHRQEAQAAYEYDAEAALGTARAMVSEGPRDWQALAFADASRAMLIEASL